MPIYVATIDRMKTQRLMAKDNRVTVGAKTEGGRGSRLLHVLMG